MSSLAILSFLLAYVANVCPSFLLAYVIDVRVEFLVARAERLLMFEKNSAQYKAIPTTRIFGLLNYILLESKGHES